MAKTIYIQQNEEGLLVMCNTARVAGPFREGKNAWSRAEQYAKGLEAKGEGTALYTTNEAYPATAQNDFSNSNAAWVVK